MRSDLTRRVFICNRCDGKTYVPLREIEGGEFVCGKCLLRPPDPTPEEIAAACEAIRAERGEDWVMDEVEPLRER